MNVHSLSKKLGLDYKTAQHHINLLFENQVIVKTGEKYGQVFFISPQMQENYALFKKLFQTKFQKEEEETK